MGIKCKVCNSTGEKLFEGYPGYIEGDKYTIYECPNCNTNWPVEDFDLDGLYDLIYRNVELIGGYSKYNKIANDIFKTKKPLEFLKTCDPTYYAIIKYIEEREFKNSKILEVGCGIGYLTFALNNSGYNTLGVDISEVSIENAKVKYGDYYKVLDIMTENEHYNSFDIIILTEVIEHVSNPTQFIDQLLKYLKTNGVILVTTPNKDIYLRGTVWSSDLPPVHQSWLSSNSFLYIAKELNLEIDFLKFKNYYYHAPEFVDLSLSKIFVSPSPIFDKNNNVKSVDFKITKYNLFTKFIKTTFIYRYVGFYLHYLYYLLVKKHKLIILGEKSTRLAVVLKKNK